MDFKIDQHVLYDKIGQGLFEHKVPAYIIGFTSHGKALIIFKVRRVKAVLLKRLSLPPQETESYILSDEIITYYKKSFQKNML